MHRLGNCALLGVIAWASSCARPKQEAVAHRVAERLPSAAPDTVCTGCPTGLSRTDSARIVYWSFVDRFPHRRSQIIRRFGAPDSIKGNSLAHQEDFGPNDSVVALYYKGLSVRYLVSAGGREFLKEVSVSDSSQRLPMHLGIGVSRSRLERIFGEPDYVTRRRDSTEVAFYAGANSGGPDQLVFILVRSSVRRIVWSYFVD